MEGSPSVPSVPGACPHDCPDRCAWVVTVEGDRAVNFVGDPAHPFTRGTLCAKVESLPRSGLQSRSRALPLRRSGVKGSGAFEPVSWDEALDDIASPSAAHHRHAWTGCHLALQLRGHPGNDSSNAMAGRFFLVSARPAWSAGCAATRERWVEATIGVYSGHAPRGSCPQPLHRVVGNQHDRHQPPPLALHSPSAGQRGAGRRRRSPQDAYRRRRRLACAPDARDRRRASAGNDGRDRRRASLRRSVRGGAHAWV